MRLRELIPALFILALSAVMFFGTRHLGYWTETAPGPAFLPTWLATAGALLFALSLAEARREGAHLDHGWPDRFALTRVALTFGGLIATPILAPLLGLLVSAVLFMAFLLLIVLRRPLWPSLATAAVTAGLIQAVFVWWLRVPLPTGLVGL
jgi:hypothetical protein